MIGFQYGEDGGAYGGPSGRRYSTPRPTQAESVTIDQGTDAETQLSLLWEPAGSAEEYAILRSETAAEAVDDYDEVATTTDTEYVDDGLINGRAYHYRIVARNAVGDAEPSDEATGTTALPAPKITGLGNDERGKIKADWAIEDDNPDGDVSVKRGGGPLTTINDLSETSFVDDDGLLDGQQYHYEIVRDTGDASAIAEDTVVSLLPDVQDLTLDNGIVDDIEVTWDPDSINNGDFEVEFEDDEEPGFEAHATLDESESSTVISELLDGQLYRVRVRTTTEFATTDWVTDDIVTKFPAVTNVEVVETTETTATIEWTDNSDNERGQIVLRQQRVDGEWWPPREVVDADPNQESFVDESVQPNRTYKYSVGTFTNYASTESEASEPAETGEVNILTDRAPAVGWYAEVDLSNGAIKRPTIIADGADWIPALKDQPQVELPVPRSPTLEDGGVEGQPLRVWKDGRRLPIEEIQSVEREVDRDVIVGIGGTELEEDIVADIPEEDAHVAARQIIEDELEWIANVDNPETDVRKDVRLLAATFGAIEDAIRGPIEDSDPFTVLNSELLMFQTAFFAEAEDASGSGEVVLDEFTGPGEPGSWSGGRSVALLSGESRTFDFSTEYEIPQGEGRAEFVFSVVDDGGDTAGFTIDVDIDDVGSETVESFTPGSLPPGDNEFDMRSLEVPLNNQGNVDEPIPPGNHSITITHNGGDEAFLDFAHIRDSRFEYDTDDTSATDGVVTGWQQYPHRLDIELATQTSIEQIVEATIRIDIDNTNGEQALALRSGGDDDWIEQSNTDELTVALDEPTQTLQSRLTLSRRDIGDESGDFGAAGQTIERIEIEADLVNTPVLIDFYHEGTYLELLNRIADTGDSIWELRLEDGEPTIEWTQPGQRVADEPGGIVDFSGKRTLEGSYQRVIAQGKSRARERETFVTTSEFGLLRGLDNEPIRPGTETVYDVGDPDNEYERLVDYELDHSEGAIRILEGGSMQTSTQYQIDYEWRFQGEYAEPGVEDPRTTRVQAPSASSNRECEQIAVAIVREVSEPLEEIKVTITEADPTRPLVESITTDQLPFEGPLRNNKVDNEPDRVVISGGSRRLLEDVLSDLNDRLQSVAREV